MNVGMAAITYHLPMNWGKSIWAIGLMGSRFTAEHPARAATPQIAASRSVRSPRMRAPRVENVAGQALLYEHGDATDAPSHPPPYMPHQLSRTFFRASGLCAACAPVLSLLTRYSGFSSDADTVCPLILIGSVSLRSTLPVVVPWEVSHCTLSPRLGDFMGG